MKNKNLYLKYIPMAITAIVIIVFAVKNAIASNSSSNGAFWYQALKTFPALLTLVVQLWMITANRYAFLLAGLNATIYGIIYFIEGVPFSGVYALCLSAPISVYSFFQWKKHSSKDQIELQHLNVKGLACTLCSIIGLWALCYFWLSKYMVVRIPLLDTAVFSLGVTVTVLLAFRYIEAQYLNIISITVTLIMWIVLTVQIPSNINFVVINAYNLYCVVQAAINWTIIRRKNKKEKGMEKNEV